jgi:hypothetical protein
MIISLGMGIHALSIAIRAITPGHCIVWKAELMKVINQCSIEDIVSSIAKWRLVRQRDGLLMAN